MTEALWDFFTGFSHVWYPILLSATAFVETVFPPFPGDVIYIALCGLGWNSGTPWILLWLPGFIGCFAATLILDSVGRSSGLQKLEKLVIGSSGKNGLVRARRILSDKGPWILSASRFIPGIRSLLVVAAASSRMEKSTVILYSTLSAGVWYVLMTAAGFFAGEGLEGAEVFLKGFNRILWFVLALGVAAGALLLARRLRRS